MAAFNPWAGFGQQQFPPGFGGFGGVPQFQNGMGNPWGQMQFQAPDQGMPQVPPGFGGGPQFLGPDQGVNQVTPGAFGGGPQLGGVGGAPVGGGSQYPDWFVQAGQQNGMNPRQMEVEWQRFMQNQGGGRQPDMGGTQGPAPQQAPPMYSGTPDAPRGGYGQMGSPRQFDPSRTGGPRGNEGGKVGGGGSPQLGNIGGSPVGNWNQSSGRLLGGGKDNSAPEGQAAGSGRWEYHSNGSRTWRPNKPKPTAAPPKTTRPPVPVKPGPGGGPTPQPSPTANNDTGPSTSNKPPVANTPPIYVPGSDMAQSSGSMPSLAASLNKRRPGQ